MTNVVLEYNIAEYPLADLAALKAIDTTLRNDGITYAVKSLGFFRLDKTSSETADDRDIIAPTVGTGRFKRLTLAFMQTTSDGKIGPSVLPWSTPLQFMGEILVAADFPTLATVQDGWAYYTQAAVIDNDPTKTNTGQSFVAYQYIVWKAGTPNKWINISGTDLWIDTGTVLKAITSRDIDLQTSGLRDANVTTAVKLGDTLNTSVTTTNKTVLGSINEVYSKCYFWQRTLISGTDYLLSPLNAGDALNITTANSMVNLISSFYNSASADGVEYFATIGKNYDNSLYLGFRPHSVAPYSFIGTNNGDDCLRFFEDSSVYFGGLLKDVYCTAGVTLGAVGATSLATTAQSLIGAINEANAKISTLTTKGDLLTYSTAIARLGVGTNGQILVADSLEATGLKWVTTTGSDYWQRVSVVTPTAYTMVSPLTSTDMVCVGASQSFGLTTKSPLVVYGNGNNFGAANWIGASIGGAQSICGRDRIVMGNLNGWATIGAHTYSLGAWSQLILGSGAYVGIGNFAQQPVLISVSSMTAVSGTVTVVTATAHQLVATQTFVISGVTDPVGVNGSQTTVTKVDEYTLRFTYGSSSWTATGTIILTPFYSGTEVVNEMLDLRGNLYTTGGIRFSKTLDHAISVDRVTSSTGKNLTLSAGGAVSGGTNIAGGTLKLFSGISTGNGTSVLELGTYTIGASGTTDNTYYGAISIGAPFSTSGSARISIQGVGTIAKNIPGIEFVLYSDSTYPIGGQYYRAQNNIYNIYGGYFDGTDIRACVSSTLPFYFQKTDTSFDCRVSYGTVTAGATITSYSQLCHYAGALAVNAGQYSVMEFWIGSANSQTSFQWASAGNGTLTLQTDKFFVKNGATVLISAERSGTSPVVDNSVHLEGSQLYFNNIATGMIGNAGQVYKDASGFLKIDPGV